MTNDKLQKIEASLNWYKPRQAAYGTGYTNELTITVKNYRRSTKDIHKKTVNMGVTASPSIARKFKENYKDLASFMSTKSGEQVQVSPVAFSFGGATENYMILNPAPNVPHVKFRIYPNNSNCDINSKSLVEDICDVYKIDSNTQFTFKIYLQYFAHINGMDLYKMQLEPFEEKQ